MGTYRIYLRDVSGICGRDDFDADDDQAAIDVGVLLADACSDVSAGFELWTGTRFVCDRKNSRLPSLPEVTERRQALLVEREEVIQGSRFAVAKSRRLLETLTEVKAMQAKINPPV